VARPIVRLKPEGCSGPPHHRGTRRGGSLTGASLAEHKLAGSMGRRGTPYDNAKAESFMKTLVSERNH